MEMMSVLANSALFSGIDPADLRGLLSCIEAREVCFEREDILLLRGEPTERLGLVRTGTVHIVREDFWGNRSIVSLAGPGEIFAESYALTGTPMGVSVQAASAGTALFFKAEKIISGCAQVCGFHERLSRNLMDLLAKKNLMLTENMRHVTRRTTREKLMSYLSAQALRAGRDAFAIPLDRQQLADFLAVERSAMSASLGKLRDEGVLEFHKNHFRLLRREDD